MTSHDCRHLGHRYHWLTRYPLGGVPNGACGVEFSAGFTLSKHGEAGVEVHGYPGRIALMGTFKGVVLFGGKNDEFAVLHLDDDHIILIALTEFFFGIGH